MIYLRLALAWALDMFSKDQFIGKVQEPSISLEEQQAIAQDRLTRINPQHQVSVNQGNKSRHRQQQRRGR